MDAAAGTAYGVIALAAYVLYVIALWRAFNKAGYPGILAIIPIVNVFFWVRIVGYSAWMTLLLLIPIVNFIFSIVVALRIGCGFGKGAVWSFSLLCLIPRRVPIPRPRSAAHVVQVVYDVVQVVMPDR